MFFKKLFRLGSPPCSGEKRLFSDELLAESRNTANGLPIEIKDAQRATTEALAELDASFFHVRFDRLTPKNGHGGARRRASSAWSYRRCAPKKGHHGRAGTQFSHRQRDGIQPRARRTFTAPLFDGFMKRIMPYL